MNLNHINLPVPDVAATRDFFTHYFGMKILLELPKNSLAILRDEGGMVLNLSHFDKASEIRYHQDFHVGYFLKTREEVDGLYARMIADGLESDPARKLPGRYAFYVDAPGGFVVEVGSVEGETWAS